MMTLQDAIAHYKEVARTYIDNLKLFGNKPLLESTKRHIARQQEFARKYEQLADWLAELQERRGADRWISVKERLPEDYGNYLVFTSDNDIDIGTYHPRYIVPQWSLCDADGFFWVEDKGIEIVKWRPLPKI